MGGEGNLIQSIVALAQLIIFLGIVTISLSGWGIFCYRTLGLPLSRSIDTGTIWLGLVVILCGSEVIHLFFPLDWKVSLGIVIVGCVAGATSSLSVYKSSIRSVWLGLKCYPFVTTVVCVMVVTCCLSALRVPNNFDSGLYHFGSIRWLNEYPIIPGLGNLHMRFAFNQSYFNFLALANIYPLWNQGYVAGGLFLLLLTAATIIETAYLEKKPWFWICGTALFVYVASLTTSVSNPTPDTAIALFQIVIFLFLFRAVSLIGYGQIASSLSPPVPRLLNLERSDYPLKDLILALCLSGTIVTIKLSSVAFAAGSCIIALFYFCRLTEIKTKVLLKFVVFLTVFQLIHVLRGFLLSGAPFFPSPFLAIWSFDWAVFHGVANYESKLIYSWARAPGELHPDRILDNWAWFEPWFNRLPVYFKASVSLATGLALWAIIYVRNETRKNLVHLRPTATLFLPIFLSFVFWFLTAPDPRFLGSVLVLFVVISGWMVSQILSVSSKKYSFVNQSINKRIVTVVGVCGVGLCSLKVMGVHSLSMEGWPQIPPAKVQRMNTLSGLEVSVASEPQQCWNENLPCAPQLNDNLQLKWFDIPMLKLGDFFARPYFSHK
jgi:hypothetical protein